ncbi:hypothetical protein KC326_g76 [Hortaea werneckii]|nr:hypothetical protein KC326_g76 [Hortaea werneckii]
MHLFSSIRRLITSQRLIALRSSMYITDPLLPHLLHLPFLKGQQSSPWAAEKLMLLYSSRRPVHRRGLGGRADFDGFNTELLSSSLDFGSAYISSSVSSCFLRGPSLLVLLEEGGVRNGIEGNRMSRPSSQAPPSTFVLHPELHSTLET